MIMISYIDHDGFFEKLDKPPFKLERQTEVIDVDEIEKVPIPLIQCSEEMKENILASFWTIEKFDTVPLRTLCFNHTEETYLTGTEANRGITSLVFSSNWDSKNLFSEL